MGIPQIVMIVMFTIAGTSALVRHGEPRTDKYNFWITLASIVAEALILRWGGFW